MRNVALLFGTALVAPACAKLRDVWFYHFSDGEAACLEALCEQIIPADKDPGARDAGVIYYIDNVLEKYFPENRADYHEGLAALQRTVQKIHGCRFEELEAEKQVALMKQLEKNQVPEGIWERQKPRDFFAMVVRHTMQGFYGSPRHGGNRDYMSYRMLKLDYPMLSGQNRYRNG